MSQILRGNQRVGGAKPNAWQEKIVIVGLVPTISGDSARCQRSSDGDGREPSTVRGRRRIILQERRLRLCSFRMSFGKNLFRLVQCHHRTCSDDLRQQCPPPEVLGTSPRTTSVVFKSSSPSSSAPTPAREGGMSEKRRICHRRACPDDLRRQRPLPEVLGTSPRTTSLVFCLAHRHPQHSLSERTDVLRYRA